MVRQCCHQFCCLCNNAVCRYTENQFDAEFIEILRGACFQYIQRQGDATLKEVAGFVRNRYSGGEGISLTLACERTPCMRCTSGAFQRSILERKTLDPSSTL